MGGIIQYECSICICNAQGQQEYRLTLANRTVHANHNVTELWHTLIKLGFNAQVFYM